jgi:hypothetical protein
MGTDLWFQIWGHSFERAWEVAAEWHKICKTSVVAAFEASLSTADVLVADLRTQSLDHGEFSSAFQEAAISQATRRGTR